MHSFISPDITYLQHVERSVRHAHCHETVAFVDPRLNHLGVRLILAKGDTGNQIQTAIGDAFVPGGDDDDPERFYTLWSVLNGVARSNVDLIKEKTIPLEANMYRAAVLYFGACAHIGLAGIF